MKKVFSVVAALAVSLFVYLFYRSEKTVVNELAVFLLTPDTYLNMKDVVASAVPLSKLIIYSLPGGLWIFCATLLAKGFYIELRSVRIQVMLVPVLFAIGLELCQLIHLASGTFDVVDIAFYVAFWLLACYSFQPQHSHQNILSPFTVDGLICVACFLSVYLAHVSQ